MKPSTRCGRVHFEHSHRKWLVITVRPTTSVRKSPRKNLPSRNTPDSFCRRFTRQNHRCAAWAVFFFYGHLSGQRPLHLAGARPLGRSKAPLGLSLLRNRGILLSEETKNPNPSPIGKKFGFCCCGAPPGTRTPGQLIKRNRCATIVNFQNHAEPLFLSSYREFAFYICCILCTCHPLLHPLSSRSGVQKVCKNVQSQNQPLKTGIGFL